MPLPIIRRGPLRFRVSPLIAWLAVPDFLSCTGNVPGRYYFKHLSTECECLVFRGEACQTTV